MLRKGQGVVSISYAYKGVFIVLFGSILRCLVGIRQGKRQFGALFALCFVRVCVTQQYAQDRFIETTIDIAESNSNEASQNTSEKHNEDTLISMRN